VGTRFGGKEIILARQMEYHLLRRLIGTNLHRRRFSFVTNHFLNSVVHSALFGGKTSWRWSDEAKKPTAAAKAKGPVTLKLLAAVLAEEHQLTKRPGQALLGDLVGIITKHLKKRERVRIAGLGILQVKKIAQPYEAQSRNRRSDQNQSKQESRVPGGQGFEDGGLAPTRLCVPKT
jgi:nucleoid DNA-binding protein